MFWIDYEKAFELMGTTIRLRDETRYVQDVLMDEQQMRMQDLPWETRTAIKVEFLRVLCEKWYQTFGERLKVVPPEGPGIAYAITYEDAIEGVVTDASGRSIEAG